jgi:hypothetical protein
MPRGEHIHIISAGENIRIAYPAIFRTLPTITHTYVLIEDNAIAISPVKEIEKQHIAVRSAIEAVKEISASLSVPCSREHIFPPVYSSVRAVLAAIHRKHPGARFTFDLSGGSKELCLAVLAVAPWLGGEVWSAFDEKVPRPVPQPDRSIRNLMENPNYPAILAVLLRKNKTAKGIFTRPWLTRSYIYSQVWPFYSRSRTRKPKPDDPVIQHRGG